MKSQPYGNEKFLFFVDIFITGWRLWFGEIDFWNFLSKRRIHFLSSSFYSVLKFRNVDLKMIRYTHKTQPII